MDERAAEATVGEAYISGALTALEDAPRTKLFYEVIAEIAEGAKLRAYLPHRVTDPVAAANIEPRTVYELDRAHVTAARVVIAYAGVPSFGVGIEVELAREHGDAEIVALLRVGELDGEAASAVRDAVARGRLFGAGLRDLVGRHALRGVDLAVFVLRDILERSLADTAHVVGLDTRATKRRLAAARARAGLAEDAEAAVVAQWLVTELIAPPTRALQLHLFAGGRAGS